MWVMASGLYFSLSWGKQLAGELCLDSMLEGMGSQGWARATRWVSGNCQGWCYLAESSAAGQAAGAVGSADGWTCASLGGKAAVLPEAVAASVCGWFGLGSGLQRAGTTFGLGGQQDGETTVWGGCSVETGLGQGPISIPDPTHPSVSWEASGP